eukprot:TRINITY_DN12808_c0_g5_i1.p1 TRINITY_DN12808_c0_g5~~TRINITY_DN12808_c0_g5_i1.p1  ORF type:complete len:249 (-),score=24.15 TRINITY_DN12808_c0_g5_i1:78-824(-)
MCVSIDIRVYQLRRCAVVVDRTRIGRVNSFLALLSPVAVVSLIISDSDDGVAGLLGTQRNLVVGDLRASSENGTGFTLHRADLLRQISDVSTFAEPGSQVPDGGDGTAKGLAPVNIPRQFEIPALLPSAEHTVGHASTKSSTTMAERLPSRAIDDSTADAHFSESSASTEASRVDQGSKRRYTVDPNLRSLLHNILVTVYAIILILFCCACCLLFNVFDVLGVRESELPSGFLSVGSARSQNKVIVVR